VRNGAIIFGLLSSAIVLYWTFAYFVRRARRR
jgi:hypothetical protein